MSGQPFHDHVFFVECSDNILSSWRKMRRASESALGVRSSTHYYEMQTNETVLLAHDILNSPDEWVYHVQR
jgi:hypothetical protein